MLSSWVYMVTVFAAAAGCAAGNMPERSAESNSKSARQNGKADIEVESADGPAKSTGKTDANKNTPDEDAQQTDSAEQETTQDGMGGLDDQTEQVSEAPGLIDGKQAFKASLLGSWRTACEVMSASTSRHHEITITDAPLGFTATTFFHRDVFCKDVLYKSTVKTSMDLGAQSGAGRRVIRKLASYTATRVHPNSQITLCGIRLEQNTTHDLVGKCASTGFASAVGNSLDQVFEQVGNELKLLPPTEAPNAPTYVYHRQ